MVVLWKFIVHSVFLGVGLAADAFSVSVANGINYPKLKVSKVTKIAGMYAVFQALMPMTGWFLTHTIMNYFRTFQHILPKVSKLFLLYLGFKMILDSRKSQDLEDEVDGLSNKELLVQAVATSIDALLVGFAIASYNVVGALVCSLLVAGVTFILCLFGVHFGKELGLRLAGRTSILSGVILIVIALKSGI